MGNIAEKDRLADVICQHRRDGTIIPIKIRIMDDDGEYQAYQIQAYKDLTHYGDCTMPNGIKAANHMWKFECKIVVFHREKKIQLFYNAYENRWKVSNLS